MGGRYGCGRGRGGRPASRDGGAPHLYLHSTPSARTIRCKPARSATADLVSLARATMPRLTVSALAVSLSLAVVRALVAGHAAANAVQAPRHWAYVSPVRPALPAVTDRSWPRHAVD